MYIHCLGHLSPLPYTTSLSPHTPHFQAELFCLFSNFVEENIGYSKKDLAFLLV
jgi:hypothetical protein